MGGEEEERGEGRRVECEIERSFRWCWVDGIFFLFIDEGEIVILLFVLLSQRLLSEFDERRVVRVEEGRERCLSTSIPQPCNAK